MNVESNTSLAGQMKHVHLQNLLGPDFETEKEITYVTPNGIKIIGHIDGLYEITCTQSN